MRFKKVSIPARELMTSRRYKSAVDKFKAVFHVADPRTEVYYVPGNNDVGCVCALC